MKKKWIYAEKYVFIFLEDEYAKLCNFEKKGGSNSTVSDILVSPKHSEKFYIDVKLEESQVGQYAISFDDVTGKCEFSKKNRSENTPSRQEVINYINRNTTRFQFAGTKGAKIDIDEKILAKCIIDQLKQKNVKYIAVYVNNTINPIIFPIEKISYYFAINGMVREKGSGSSNVPKKYRENVAEYIAKTYPGATITYDEKVMYANIPITLKEDRFQVGKNIYYFSEMDKNNQYKVRKLSNTNNLNVIFDLKFKYEQDPKDLKQFEDEISA